MGGPLVLQGFGEEGWREVRAKLGKPFAAGAHGGYDDPGAAVCAGCPIEERSDEGARVHKYNRSHLLQACCPCSASCPGCCLHGYCVPAGAVLWGSSRGGGWCGCSSEGVCRLV